MARMRNGKRRIGIRDRLGRLTYRGACRLLGDEPEEGAARLRQGGRFEIDLASDVHLGGDTLRVRMPDPDVDGGAATVAIVEMTTRPQGLHLDCDRCETRCPHIAATLGMVLDEKLTLGLAAPPDPNEPIENLTEQELLRRALADREERAASEKMTLRSIDSTKPWTDYIVTSHLSGKTYRVALRGFEAGQSYCSCPDFRTNHLGTCKHILSAQKKVRKRFAKKQLVSPYRRRNLSLRIDYGERIGLRFNLPDRLNDGVGRILGPCRDRTTDDVDDVVKRVRRLERSGHSVDVYPDAEEFIEQRLTDRRLQREADEIRRDPEHHPLRRELLRAELLPYQLDGIAFAVGAGRAVLADDMGLGKTIQVLAMLDIRYSRLAADDDDAQMTGPTFVVAPRSVVYNWLDEAKRFTPALRVMAYSGNEREALRAAFGDHDLIVTSYGLMRRDIASLSEFPFDYVILDEAQTIKNPDSQGAKAARLLKARHRLALTGTPVENHLGDLWSIFEFLNPGMLGVAGRFGERIKAGMQHLRSADAATQAGRALRPFILRRTKQQVLTELPDKTEQTLVCEMEPEQQEIYQSLLQHYRGTLLRQVPSNSIGPAAMMVLEALLRLRQAACHPGLIDPKLAEHPSAKLDLLTEQLEEIIEEGHKTLVFSQFTSFLSLVKTRLERENVVYEYLDGQTRNRKERIERFQTDSDCSVFLISLHLKDYEIELQKQQRKATSKVLMEDVSL